MPRARTATSAAMKIELRRARFGSAVAAGIDAAVAHATAPGRHGRLPEWQAALEALPSAKSGWMIEDGVLVAGAPIENHASAVTPLKVLMPWRKGPLRLGGVAIDTEWRSDWKWDRVRVHIDLEGAHVLDIGGGNGYFGWRMLEAGAASVTVCDPTLLFWMQHRAIEHFAGPAALDFLPLRFEGLPDTGGFDQIFSMGVLYHRRDPLEHLDRIRRHLAPGGALILETLVIPGDTADELDPPDRYANMRNVHRLPTVRRLCDWLSDAGFGDIDVFDRTLTTIEEQRPTDWMPFHSLEHALSEDRRTTIEGHPPPLRTIIGARKP